MDSSFSPISMAESSTSSTSTTPTTPPSHESQSPTSTSPFTPTISTSSSSYSPQASNGTSHSNQSPDIAIPSPASMMLSSSQFGTADSWRDFLTRSSIIVARGITVDPESLLSLMESLGKRKPSISLFSCTITRMCAEILLEQLPPDFTRVSLNECRLDIDDHMLARYEAHDSIHLSNPVIGPLGIPRDSCES